MRLKVRNGTQEHSGENLCLSCRRSTWRKDRSGHTYIQCHAFERKVDSVTVECSEYDDKGRPALWDMEKIAWVLMSDKKGPIGFRPIKDLTDEEKRKLGLDRY